MSRLIWIGAGGFVVLAPVDAIEGRWIRLVVDVVLTVAIVVLLLQAGRRRSERPQV